MIDREPNIFVLTIDSLRADVYRRLMNEINTIVQGTDFTNAFATASNTGSSMPTLAAGVFCDELAEGTPNLDLGETADEDGLTTMAEALSANGYECSLWSDNIIFGSERNYDRGFRNGRTGTPNWKKRAQMLVQKSGSDRLFDLCRWTYFNIINRVEKTVRSSNSYYTPASNYHRAVLDALDQTSGRQFHWVHYMDAHHPFDPPSSYLESRELNTSRSPTELAELSSNTIIRNDGGDSSDADIEDIEQAYWAACEYLRDQIIEFIEQLVDQDHYIPGYDLFVLTSDHGEGFDLERHGMLGHTPTPSFWDDLVRVPLLVSLPDWESNVVDYQVSLIDLMPTVLNATDTPIPDFVEGTVAVKPSDMNRDHVFFTATGPYRTYHGLRRQDGWKLFADRISDSSTVSLTGTNEADDHERVLLTRVKGREESIRFERSLDKRSTPSDVQDRKQWLALERRLQEERGSVATRRFDVQLTDETIDQLEQLGYVDNIR